MHELPLSATPPSCGSAHDSDNEDDSEWGELVCKKLSVSTRADDDAESFVSEPDDDDEPEDEQAICVAASVGSVLHGTGSCRPCAWFWKVGGCQNGRECRHCHLCPQGELKARRTARVEALRGSRQAVQQSNDEKLPEPLQVAVRSSLISAPPALLMPPPGLPTPAPPGLLLAPPPGLAPPQAAWPPALPRTQRDGGSGHEHARAPRMPHTLAFMEEPIDGLSMSDLPLSMPSEGSALHCIGECKPCTWFWKPQGCQNGRACRHCHLCPHEKVKTRKKSLRQQHRQQMTWVNGVL